MSEKRKRRERSEDPEALKEEPLVSVREVPDEQTATMLIDFLKSQGIEATAVPVQIAWLSTVETMHHGFWGRIEVLGRDAERARTLIRDFLAASPDEPGEART